MSGLLTAAKRVFSDREDAQAGAQLAHALVNNPIEVLHRAPLEQAREIYRDSLGLQLATTYSAALRLATPAEMSERDDDTSEDSEDRTYRKRTGLVADSNVRQLRCELDRSSLVAVTIPAGSTDCAAYGALMAAGGDCAFRPS